MTEYVSKTDVLNLPQSIERNLCGEIVERSIDVKAIESLPPADVAPVRHGHWTLVGWHKGMKVVECSCCKKRAIGSTDFCPNCGAKMDGKREE